MKTQITFIFSLLILFRIEMAEAQAPQRFALDLLSEKVEYGFTLTPDQKTAYFVKTDSFYVSKPRAIYRSHWNGEEWSSPVLASFSGNYQDTSPFISPDGNKLFFTSRRPVNGQEVDGGNIWYVSLRNGKAGNPIFLEGVNSEKSEYSPSVDKNGNLYFGSYRDGGVGYGDLWWAEFKDGTYQKPKNLGTTVNTPNGEWGSCISPDGNTLIFENSGNEGNLSAAGDLFITFRQNGTWQKPIHFPAPINSVGSDLTPKLHGQNLYFASNRPRENGAFNLNNVDLYYISISDLMKFVSK